MGLLERKILFNSEPASALLPLSLLEYIDCSNILYYGTEGEQYLKLKSKCSLVQQKNRVHVFATYWENHLITALHPRQVNCFFANFIIPLFEGVEIETALV
jgi:hypothetical protein